MKEWTKEWMGIKKADFIIYGAFLLLIPVYYSSNIIIDIIFIVIGLMLCLASCFVGMKSSSKLGQANNLVKKFAYPGCTILFLYLAYLNFTAWQ